MPDGSELDAKIARAVADARIAWPALSIGDAHAHAYFKERVLASDDPDAAIAKLHASDLYVACACATNDSRAMAAFDEKFLTSVSTFVSQIDSSAAFADEVRQELREKLFVPKDSGKPKILEYTGRGPLGGWLRVSSVRTALNMRRGRKNHVDADEGPALSSPSPDPELDYLKHRYRLELREAFQNTLSSLDADERSVLRMHYLDGLNIDEIGAAYKVHRSTVARWIATAREKMLAETRRIMSERLRLSGPEVDSVIGLVRSQLDVSIFRFLDEAPHSKKK
jgi:RNA polymerase sigma-70 factor (ECF subfamily)